MSEARKAAPTEEPIEVGDKPTVVGCDYDEDAFGAELEAWNQRKPKATEAETAPTPTPASRMRNGKEN